MKQKIIRRISNGEMVDLSTLRKKELKRLHYEEEKFVAKKVLNMPPFSKERDEYMKSGYDLVSSIMPWYLPSANISYGANKSTVKLVCDLIKCKKKEKLLYEAGVGTGFSCGYFVKVPNLKIKGCDMLLSDKIKYIMERYANLSLDEENLYCNLRKLSNNSLDYFYADNVFEHLFPDEFPKILHLLSCKMKRDGLVILIIPNRLVGPGDVSRFYLKQGKAAEGFHFMELSYREVIVKFKDYGIFPKYFVWRDKTGDVKYRMDPTGVMNDLKVCTEYVLSYLVKNPELKKKLFYNLALDCYVFEKR